MDHLTRLDDGQFFRIYSEPRTISVSNAAHVRPEQPGFEVGRVSTSRGSSWVSRRLTKIMPSSRDGSRSEGVRDVDSICDNFTEEIFVSRCREYPTLEEKVAEDKDNRSDFVLSRSPHPGTRSFRRHESMKREPTSRSLKSRLDGAFTREISREYSRVIDQTDRSQSSNDHVPSNPVSPGRAMSFQRLTKLSNCRRESIGDEESGEVRMGRPVAICRRTASTDLDQNWDGQSARNRSKSVEPAPDGNSSRLRTMTVKIKECYCEQLGMGCEECNIRSGQCKNGESTTSLIITSPSSERARSPRLSKNGRKKSFTNIELMPIISELENSEDEEAKPDHPHQKARTVGFSLPVSHENSPSNAKRIASKLIGRDQSSVFGERL